MLLPGTLHRIHLSGFMSAEGISTCLKKQNLLSISQPGISVWIILNTRKIKQQYQQTQSVSEAKDPDFLHEITYQETLRILHQAIDTLPPQTRKIILLGKVVFKLVILEDMKYKDVADSLGISVNTVKSLKKSAYTSLRGQLKDPMLFLLFLLIDS